MVYNQKKAILWYLWCTHAWKITTNLKFHLVVVKLPWAQVRNSDTTWVLFDIIGLYALNQKN